MSSINFKRLMSEGGRAEGREGVRRESEKAEGIRAEIRGLDLEKIKG